MTQYIWSKQSGLNDDNMTLIYEANNEVKMAVNTPSRLSERQDIENVVLRVDTFGDGLLLQVQVPLVCLDWWIPKLV